MSLEFTIGLFAGYTLVIYGVFRFVLSSYKKENHQLGVKLGELEKNFLSKEFEIIQREGEVQRIHRENTIIYTNNKETLKLNQLELYNIRHASIFAYKQYCQMSDLFRHLLVFDDGDTPIFQHLKHALNLTDDAKHKTSKYFQLFFKMTPEEYDKLGGNVTGKRFDGSDYVSDYSIN